MNITLDENKMATLFLSVYRGTVVEKLYNDLLADVKPKLRKAAEEAAKELEPQIRTYMDHLKEQVVVQLTVKGLEDKANAS